MGAVDSNARGALAGNAGDSAPSLANNAFGIVGWLRKLVDVTPQVALPYTDKSVASLATNQAAGTALVLAANAARRALTIMPNADGRLYFTGSAAADGPYYPLYAGVARTISGAECPAGVIYVTGQTAGTKLRIGEA